MRMLELLEISLRLMSGRKARVLECWFEKVARLAHPNAQVVFDIVIE